MYFGLLILDHLILDRLILDHLIPGHLTPGDSIFWNLILDCQLHVFQAQYHRFPIDYVLV